MCWPTAVQEENKNQNWAVIASTEMGYWDSQMTDLSLASVDLHPNWSGNQQSRDLSQLRGMQNKWYKINYLVFNFKFEFFDNFISCSPIQLNTHTHTHTPHILQSCNLWSNREKNISFCMLECVTVCPTIYSLELLHCHCYILGTLQGDSFVILCLGDSVVLDE